LLRRRRHAAGYADAMIFAFRWLLLLIIAAAYDTHFRRRRCHASFCADAAEAPLSTRMPLAKCVTPRRCALCQRSRYTAQRAAAMRAAMR